MCFLVHLCKNEFHDKPIVAFSLPAALTFPNIADTFSLLVVTNIGPMLAHEFDKSPDWCTISA